MEQVQQGGKKNKNEKKGANIPRAKAAIFFPKIK